MLTQGVTFLGGVLVVFGLINLGMTIKTVCRAVAASSVAQSP